MPVINRIAEFHAEMAAWRQDLHAHPELALQEVRTSKVVQEKLREFGVDEIITGMAHTGVVGVIKGHGEGGAIGLRADMDALPENAFYMVGTIDDAVEKARTMAAGN